MNEVRSSLLELQKLIRDKVGDSTAVVLVISPRPAPGRLAPEASSSEPARCEPGQARRPPDVADFVRDWTSGATPLPVGAVASVDLFSGFLTWAERLGRRVYASDLNTFVPAAIDAGGLRKRRARFRIGGDRGQAMVLSPEGIDDCRGQALGSQIAAFRSSLAGWHAEHAQASAPQTARAPALGINAVRSALGSSSQGEGVVASVASPRIGDR